MASSSSKRSPEELVRDLKKQLTPSQFQERLEEQLSLAMACQSPPMTGFKIVGEKCERLDQLRQLNIYKEKLKMELPEDEGPQDDGLARPVEPAPELAEEEGDEAGGARPPEKKRRKRRGQDQEEEAGREEDGQKNLDEDEEMDPAEPADDTKKKEKEKEKEKQKDETWRRTRNCIRSSKRYFSGKTTEALYARGDAGGERFRKQ